MNLFATTSSDEGMFYFLVIVICLVGGLFHIWKIVKRPDVYKAELQEKQHKREQRNRMAGSVLGVGGRILGEVLRR
jgi:hypothetical protein